MAMNGAPVILDRQLRPVAILDTASNICWEKKHNDLCTAEFSLAHEDPLNAECAAMAWVHMMDGSRDLGVYRIAGMPSGEEEAGGTMTYSLDHVLALLLDKVIFGKMELTDVPIGDAIRQLLALQVVENWILGDCDFETKVTLECENETVLSGIQKACEQLKEEYTWSYDTSHLPFVLSIRKADEDNGCGIHHGRGLVGVQKQMDASTLVTRLYLLGGADESGSQVTVEKLTEGGTPYIDADTISLWGVKEAIYQNGDLTTPEALLHRGQAVLDSYKNPFYTYTATALDLYQMTGYAWDLYEPGKKVLVMDDENGVRFSARIVTVSKQDCRADPGSITITIASKPRDELNTVAVLAQKLQSVESDGIDNMAANIATGGRLGGAISAIEKNTEDILLRVTKEEHDALTGRVTQAESSLAVQAEGIALVSGRTTTLEDEMVETKAQIRVNNDSIGMLVTKTESLDGRVTDAEAELVLQADRIASKVSQDEYDTYVTQTAQAIELRATQYDLNALGNRVTTAEATLSVQAGKIAGNAKEIELQAETIRLKADKTYVDKLVADEINAMRTDTVWLDGAVIKAGQLSVGGVPVTPKDYIKDSDLLTILPNYALKSWVEEQGYLKSVPSTYATQEWTKLNFVTLERLAASKYATQFWVNSQGFLTSLPSHRHKVTIGQKTINITPGTNASFTVGANGTYNTGEPV